MRLLALGLTALLLATAISGCTGGKGGKGNGLPIVQLNITPSPTDPQVFTFDATNSSDPEGGELFVYWSFGDEGKLYKGSMEENGIIEYTYAVPNAVYHVGLVVEDPDGNRAAMERNVSVGTGVNHAPTLIVGNTSRWVRPGTEITIDSSRSVDADDDLFNTEWVVGNYSAVLPPEAVIGSPLLSMGGTFNQTFNALGYYDYHCHPHPWMRGRVIVSDSRSDAAAGTATVEMAAYSFQPRLLVVQPGTKVQWINQDPVPHNVTMDHFSPGKLQGEGTSSALLAVRLPVGDHQANLLLDDLKGGRSWRSFGLRVTADGPEKFLTTYANQSDVNTGTSPPALPPYAATVSYAPEWPQNLTGTVSWTDPGAMSSFTIELYKKETGAKLAGCIADGTSCSFTANVDPAFYDVKLKGSGTGFQVDLTVTLSAIQYTNPGFGDASSEGTIHPHH